MINMTIQTNVQNVAKKAKEERRACITIEVDGHAREYKFMALRFVFRKLYKTCLLHQKNIRELFNDMIM